MIYYSLLFLLFTPARRTQNFSAPSSENGSVEIAGDYFDLDLSLLRRLRENRGDEILSPAINNINNNNGTFDEKNGTFNGDDLSFTAIKSENFSTTTSSSYDLAGGDLISLHDGSVVSDDATTIVNISNGENDDDEQHSADDTMDRKSHDELDDLHSGNISEVDFQEAPVHRSARGPVGSDDQGGRSTLTWLIPTIVVVAAVLILVGIVGVVVKVRKSRRSSSRRVDDEDEGSAGERVTRYPDYIGPPSFEESISVPSLTDGSVSDREIQALQSIENVKRTAKGHSTSNKQQKGTEVEVF